MQSDKLLAMAIMSEKYPWIYGGCTSTHPLRYHKIQLPLIAKTQKFNLKTSKIILITLVCKISFSYLKEKIIKNKKNYRKYLLNHLKFAEKCPKEP